MPPPLRSLLQLLLLAAASPTGAGELYSTDFEAFTPGDNKWAGTEGWLTNDPSSNVQGIIVDYGTDLYGNTAFLGFDQPLGDFTRVFRPVNYDPAVGNIPWVEFQSHLGVQDSTNGYRDRFYIAFWNNDTPTPRFLAAIAFDLTEVFVDPDEPDSVFGKVLREDGLVETDLEDTGVPLLLGNQLFAKLELVILFVEIDLVANTWSASLEGIPLFADVQFTATGFSRTLGSVAAEWELGIPDTSSHGNNWLFVADWAVRTAPRGIEPFVIETITRNPAGETTITWHGDPGFDYQVHYSADLVTWHKDLTDSRRDNITTAGTLSFKDTYVGPQKRFYAVSRSVTP
jgi:hypothetical protein